MTHCGRGVTTRFRQRAACFCFFFAGAACFSSAGWCITLSGNMTVSLRTRPSSGRTTLRPRGSALRPDQPRPARPSWIARRDRRRCGPFTFAATPPNICMVSTRGSFGSQPTPRRHRPLGVEAAAWWVAARSSPAAAPLSRRPLPDPGIARACPRASRPARGANVEGASR